MKRKGEGHKNPNQLEHESKARRLVTLFALAEAAILLVYVFCAYPFYMKTKTDVMKEVYQGLSEMALCSLSEEDEELIDSYRREYLYVAIVDSEFRTVYSNRPTKSQEQIGSYIQSHLDDYQEVPTIRIQKNNEMRIMRMRGLLMQEQPYYIYIRKEVRSAGEVIRYTTAYLCFGVGLSLIILYFIAKHSFAKMGTGKSGEADGTLSFPDNGSVRRDAALDGPLTSAVGASSETPPEASAQLARAQKEFVANVSHELKTPLAVISGQVEMLQSMGAEIDREYYFSSIREEIGKMSDMVGTLLDLTTIENKLEQMELTGVDFSELLEYMVLKYDALFCKNGIRLETDIISGCRVQANRMYLEQAVNNYIMNAFQHTAQGNAMRIGLAKEDSLAVFSVYNEGVQISEGDMERIWESFYRSQKTGQGGRKAYGSRNAGLGLYMVRKIVDWHGGECGVQNKDAGVEFWMRLPLDKT